MTSLKELFDAYKVAHQSSRDVSIQDRDQPSSSSQSQIEGARKVITIGDKYKMQKLDNEVVNKSELDIYCSALIPKDRGNRRRGG